MCDLQDLFLQRYIRELPLPTTLLDIILWYSNDVNERIKERTCRLVEAISAGMVLSTGEAKTMRDLIQVSENSGLGWAWNKHFSMSPWWRFVVPPSRIQCEIACRDIGLDFGEDCHRHSNRWGECDERCRNGRNRMRAGLNVRRPLGWFRCVDYWRCGRPAPDRDGWVDGSNR